MGESTAQVREEIDMNRRSAADKIDQIQSQLENTTEQLRTGVQDSAQQVRDQVKGTIDDTMETMKQNFDLRQQIEERPLVALGAALVGGFVLGGLMGGGGHSQNGGNGHTQPTASQSGHHGSSAGHGVRSAIQKSGLEDTISNAASALIGSLTDQLRDTLDRNFPGFAEKMQTTQQTDGDFADKTRRAQSTQV